MRSATMLRATQKLLMTSCVFFSVCFSKGNQTNNRANSVERIHQTNLFHDGLDRHDEAESFSES